MRSLLWPFLLALLLTILSTEKAAEQIAFTPLLDVQLYNELTGEVTWRTVGDHGRIREATPFDPSGCRSQEFRFPDITMTREDGISNPLSDEALTPENRALLAREPAVAGMMAQVSALPHDVMTARVLYAGEQWFLSVSLNVNWSYPWHLYHYDPATHALTHLAVFERVEPMALRIAGPTEEGATAP